MESFGLDLQSVSVKTSQGKVIEIPMEGSRNQGGPYFSTGGGGPGIFAFLFSVIYTKHTHSNNKLRKMMNN